MSANSVTRRSHSHRIVAGLIGRVAAALLLGVAIVAVNVTPSSAEPYAASGTWGPFDIPTPSCKQRLNSNIFSSITTAYPPRVFAKNLRAGWGNDAAWVRYAVYYVNQSTGATESTSSWSGWSRATDNTPATWSGAGATFSHSSNQPHQVHYRMEFWDSTKMTGWVADRQTNYSYVTYQMYGPFKVSSC